MNMFFIEVMVFFDLISLSSFFVCIFMHFHAFIVFITIESLVAHAPLFVN